MMVQTLFPVEIAAVTRAAEAVVALDLVPAGETLLPPWAPGAHIDLHLPSGRIRKYSLCGDPADRRRYRIAVLRQGEAGGSAEIHDALAVGHRLPVSGPFNHFPLEPAAGYLFVAGGIGITPLLPMIEAVAAQRRPWRLIYVGRSRAGMAFAERLAGHAGRVVSIATEESGRPDLAAAFAALPEDHAVYSCGPEAMMAELTALAAAAGRPDAVHIERFGAPARAPDATAEAHGFEVVLVGGERFQVPAERSIVEVLRDAGVACAMTCSEGYCGACLTSVVEGAVDHRDSYLTAAEQASGRMMMICVSRAKGDRLVIDLTEMQAALP